MTKGIFFLTLLAVSFALGLLFTAMAKEVFDLDAIEGPTLSSRFDRLPKQQQVSTTDCILADYSYSEIVADETVLACLEQR